MPTRLWDVRSKLIALFTAGVAVEQVFDGPMSRTSPPRSFLLVGTDGGETGAGDGFDDGATVEQALSAMGNNWRDERGEITCAVWRWSGDTDFVSLRSALKTDVDTVETLIQADRTLGGVLAPPGLAELISLRVRETQTQQGAVIRGAFTVTYGALITT